ncbi:MAG: GGDEF domain-containing protein [Lachnospiraceae bacterium]|nr:GGDEF domain-containing protein [Lachnospiraceae bacterium]
MADNQVKRIAVCFAGINEEYNDSLINAAYRLTSEYNFKLLYFCSFSPMYEFEKHDKGESHVFHLINFKEIDGLILFSETIKKEEVRMWIVERAKQEDVPVISIDHYIEGCYNINFRYTAALEKIITHLVEEHHFTRLNFVAGIKGNSFSEERLDVYKRVLAEHDIPIEDERILYGNFCYYPTKEKIRAFLESDILMPEAFVCANDTMAIATIEELMEAGYSIPGDVMVTGMDGIREALAHSPAIITAKQDFDTTMLRAFQMLRAHLDGKKVEKQVWIDSKVIYDQETGVEQQLRYKYTSLNRNLYNQLDDYESFTKRQIEFTEDLADNHSFQDVFENLKKYPHFFFADSFWLCIVDDYMSEKEALMDIIDDFKVKKTDYSGTMNLMLARRKGEWLGIIDFPTKILLPDLDAILEEENNLMFFPLHLLEQTIGYVAVVYDPQKMNMYHAYQIFMNIGITLEGVKIRQQQQAIIDNLEIKYVHDPMTGLLNRRGFYQQLAPVYESCASDGTSIMFVSVDLNGLKPINDTYGHADGDLAISTVGKSLVVSAADRDYTCARFGGDEFVVAGQIQSEDEMDVFCRKVREFLDSFNEKSQKPYKLSASIGAVCGAPEVGMTMDEFIKVADEKMYEEKVRYHSRAR